MGRTNFRHERVTQRPQTMIAALIITLSFFKGSDPAKVYPEGIFHSRHIYQVITFSCDLSALRLGANISLLFNPEPIV